MPPKKDAAPKGGGGSSDNQEPGTEAQRLLDVIFPVWDDKALPADPKDDKYVDTEGQCVPQLMKKFVDTWKRPEQLTAGTPVIPIVDLKLPDDPADKNAKPGGESGREQAATLFSGHDSVEWLRSVFYAIMERMGQIAPKNYLWELIYPQDAAGKPVLSQGGQYHVRLFVMDQWRRVTVDDRIPVDLFGRPVLVGAIPIMLWPLILSKAVLKLMATYQTLECQFPSEVPAFLWLTGWLREGLPTTPREGVTFERMFQSLKESSNITTVSLRERAAPEKPPPRMLVFCGPSGVGKGRLKAKILEEYADKFGKTVSTTTRLPREHEAEGQDFFFTNRTDFKMNVDDKRFLEWAEVGPRGLYGVGLATVREVAATGKLCVMGIDFQGCRTLKENEAVDAMFVYVKPPSMEELESRLRGRPIEAESTIQKRLMNAQEQMAASEKEGVFDHVVNNEEVEQVYMDIKEAISELSPVIRNRLRGLPAYVLDYADVIPSNQVEKAVLKPIVIAGPSNGGDKQALIDRLVEEFPDVFGFAVATTTRKARDGEEEGRDFNFVTAEQLEEGLKEGSYLESHEDMFVHPSLIERHATSKAAVQDVIDSGRMCLLNLDAESAEEARKNSPEGKCMTIFLKPPSFEEFERRLRAHLTESDESIAGYLDKAAREMEEAEESDVFDYVLTLDDLEGSYQDLKDQFSKARPDIIVPKEESGVPAKLEAPIVVCGPCCVGKSTLIERLRAEFPDKVGFCLSHTTRKPRDGEVDGEHYYFVSLEKFKEDVAMGLFLETTEYHGELYGTSIAAVQDIAASGKLCILDIDIEGARAVKSSQFKDATLFFIAPPSPEVLEARIRERFAAAKDAEEEMAARLAKMASDLEASREEGLFDHVVVNEDVDATFVDLRSILSRSHAIPPPIKPLVVGGTFGTGKADFLARVEEEFPRELVVPKIHTTRAPREGELPPPVEEEAEPAPPSKGGKAPAKGEKAPPPPEEEAPPPPESEYIFVSREEFEAAVAEGRFLQHEEVLGEYYGIAHSSVKKLQAANKVCLLDADRVETAAALKAGGLEALYHFIEPLPQHIPQGFEALAAGELEASRAEGLFDSRSQGEDAEVGFFQLKEALCLHYPHVVPTHSVWGYGRGMWDAPTRVHGEHPLRVIILGPAASGKSTVAERAVRELGLPWVAAGELLQEAIKAKTEIGLRAKVFMDNTQTVPDDILIHLVKERLKGDDCRRAGWLLDGFPHTPLQVEALQREGVVPDKVIMLQARHEVLLERVKGRQLDPKTGLTYHSTHKPAEDEEVQARLTIRHDDTEDNVRARLGFYDVSEEGIRAAYEEISRVVDGEQDIPALFEEVDQFIRQESLLEDQVAVVDSRKLKEVQYTVVEAIKFQRRSLLRLQQPDGKRFWVDLAELAGNSVCFLENRDPASLEATASDRRLDLSHIPTNKLLFVDSLEPIHLLVSLQVGIQAAIPPGGVWPVQKTKPVVLVGPSGVGKSTLIDLLVKDFPDKFGFSVSHTTRAPRSNETAGVHYHFVSRDEFSALRASNHFLEVTSAHGNQYGTGFDAVDRVTKEGKMCILDVDIAGAKAIRQAGIDALFIFINGPSLDDLDQRLRRRGSETEVQIIQRMEDAKVMISEAEAPGLFDHSVVNVTLLGCYSEIKRLLAPHWPRAARPRLAHLLLERYSWMADCPGETIQRHETFTSSSTRLSLPRGRHLLRVVTDQSFLYSSAVHSRTPFTLAEASEVLKENEGLATYDVAGQYLEQSGKDWSVWFRQVLRVEEPTQVTSQLFLSDFRMAPFSRFLTVNNDTGEEHLHIVGRAPARTLVPNEHGYTLMCYSHCTAPLPPKGWRLSVGTDKPLKDIAPVANDKEEVFDAEYSPNRLGILCRYALAVTERTQLSFHTETSHMAAYKVTILAPAEEEEGEAAGEKDAAGAAAGAGAGAGAGAAGEGGGERVVHEWFANQLLTLPAVNLDPIGDGKRPYILQLRLNPSRCKFDLLPNGDVSPPFPAPPPEEGAEEGAGGEKDAAAAAAAGRLRWRLKLYASKPVAVSEDDARRKLFESTITGWAEADKGRPNAAKAALAQFSEEQAAEERPPPVKDPKEKDGEPLSLDPPRFQRVLPPAPKLWDDYGRVTDAVKEAAKVVPPEVFSEREEGMAAAVESAARVLEDAAGRREATHEEREAEGAAKMEDYAAWRQGVLTAREEAQKKRAEWLASKRPPTAASGEGSAGG